MYFKSEWFTTKQYSDLSKKASDLLKDLISFSNKDYECFPSFTTLCSSIKCSRHRLSLAFKELKEKKVIEITKKGQNNFYKINVDWFSYLTSSATEPVQFQVLTGSATELEDGVTGSATELEDGVTGSATELEDGVDWFSYLTSSATEPVQFPVLTGSATELEDGVTGSVSSRAFLTNEILTNHINITDKSNFEPFSVSELTETPMIQRKKRKKRSLLTSDPVLPQCTRTGSPARPSVATQVTDGLETWWELIDETTKEYEYTFLKSPSEREALRRLSNYVTHKDLKNSIQNLFDSDFYTIRTLVFLEKNFETIRSLKTERRIYEESQEKQKKKILEEREFRKKREEECQRKLDAEKLEKLKLQEAAV
jgi:hypothetical protein